MLKSRAQGGRWWTSWYGPEGINVPSWLSCFHPTNSHPLFGLPSAVRYPLPISLLEGTIWILHQVFSPPDYYLIPFYKNTTTKSLMHLLLFYHPFSSRKDVPTGPFWLKKQRHFIFGTLSRQWTLFMGILSHQTLGTGCYWWQYSISWVFHSWGSDNLPKSWFQISQCMLLKQFSNDLPTTKDKFLLSSFHLLLPDSCINHDLTLRTGNLCVPVRWEDVFNCYPGRWRTEAHAQFRTPSISLPIQILLAGPFLQ